MRVSRCLEACCINSIPLLVTMLFERLIDRSDCQLDTVRKEVYVVFLAL